LSGPDKTRTHQNRADVRPSDTGAPESGEESKEQAAQGVAKKKPVFRFARLDGRDTLKYEDTADK
jgi:hypothetical protein